MGQVQSLGTSPVALPLVPHPFWGSAAAQAGACWCSFPVPSWSLQGGCFSQPIPVLKLPPCLPIFPHVEGSTPRPAVCSSSDKSQHKEQHTNEHHTSSTPALRGGTAGQQGLASPWQGSNTVPGLSLRDTSDTWAGSSAELPYPSPTPPQPTAPPRQPLRCRKARINNGK